MADNETIKIPDPGQLLDLAVYFQNWATDFDDAENKLNNIFVTPGKFEAAAKLKKHVEDQRTNFETNLTALSAASKELEGGLVVVAGRYKNSSDKSVDVSNDLNTTVTNLNNDLPGFNDYKSTGKD